MVIVISCVPEFKGLTKAFSLPLCSFLCLLVLFSMFWLCSTAWRIFMPWPDTEFRIHASAVKAQCLNYQRRPSIVFLTLPSSLQVNLLHEHSSGSSKVQLKASSSSLLLRPSLCISSEEACLSVTTMAQGWNMPNGQLWVMWGHSSRFSGQHLNYVNQEKGRWDSPRFQMVMLL